MSQVADIIKGHYNELVGSNDDLEKTRLAICEKCPLYRKASWGPTCDSKKYISTIDKKSWSWVRQPNYVRGCGCRLTAKTRLPSAHCIAGSW